ncbi:hypothetical protein D3C84_1122910 [compost metagenome]
MVHSTALPLLSSPYVAYLAGMCMLVQLNCHIAVALNLELERLHEIANRSIRVGLITQLNVCRES